MNNTMILVFILAFLTLSGCDSETESETGDHSGVSDKHGSATDSKQPVNPKTVQAEAFKSESRLVTNSRTLKAQLSAYTKSYLDLAEVYVLKLQVGAKEIKLTSLNYIEISSKLNTSRTLFTFTKPRNYVIFYSYDGIAKQGHEMRIPTDSLKAGQFADFPVVDEKTGKLISTRIELLKIQHKS